MAKLITETSFKALIQAIGKKLGQIDTQVAADKSKLADLETNFDTKAVRAINDELGRDILEVKADAEDAKRLLVDLKQTAFGSDTPYKVAKASEFETLKGVVDTFFAKNAGESFDENLDTLKEIINYLKTNPSGASVVTDVRDLKNVVNRLTSGDGLYNDRLEPNLEKINSTRSISWRIDKALEQYVTTSKLSDQLGNYVNNSDLLDFDDSIRSINEHLFDNKLVVTKSGTDDVNINLNATDPQMPKEDRL